ncbi:hypothetical protein Rsub_10928 [Raphidocelis subcapitata]|uniref:Uncharacterized protein n=1 Tax=Raphidocelis subcapitata TaxID=307507 RepID=A0A2V0PMH1_9CHLO|nr:hypothetical protein Rsub_10928 [Raphidocelis subcapitata]|eukprot:GBF98265.1 hypothetical protein Rsub_10928 [Raphidocelis subcapitata]
MVNTRQCRLAALAASAALLLVHAAALAAAAGPQGASGPPDLPPGIVGAPVAPLPSGVHPKSAAAPPVQALPEGFAGFVPGVCTGYAYCIPGHAAPAYKKPGPLCPDGFSLSADGAGCAKTELSCPPGAALRGGRCCEAGCFAALADACPSDTVREEDLCGPSKAYDDVAARVKIDARPEPTAKEAAPASSSFRLRLEPAAAGGAAEERTVTLPSGAAAGVSSPAALRGQLLPKCFRQCCKRVARAADGCTEPEARNYTAKPTVGCPPGCSKQGEDVCLCGKGGPIACPPLTRECGPAAEGGRICATEISIFGVDPCTVVGAIRPHLPVVPCPDPATMVPAGGKQGGGVGGGGARDGGSSGLENERKGRGAGE